MRFQACSHSVVTEFAIFTLPLLFGFDGRHDLRSDLILILVPKEGGL
jgi:hypothetical protein